MTTLRSLLQLPETVAKGHFVVRLTEGIEHPEALLGDYAVTPDLAAGGPAIWLVASCSCWL